MVAFTARVIAFSLIAGLQVHAGGPGSATTTASPSAINGINADIIQADVVNAHNINANVIEANVVNAGPATQTVTVTQLFPAECEWQNRPTSHHHRPSPTPFNGGSINAGVINAGSVDAGSVNAGSLNAGVDNGIIV
ncbi:hypothetical protein HDU98_001030 [Podochytrium sp. JEL0797]|nr:hypothetical protein HDU98_001030 [Podochytrium sp. JEL0797]